MHYRAIGYIGNKTLATSTRHDIMNMKRIINNVLKIWHRPIGFSAIARYLGFANRPGFIGDSPGVGYCCLASRIQLKSSRNSSYSQCLTIVNNIFLILNCTIMQHLAGKILITLGVVLRLPAGGGDLLLHLLQYGLRPCAGGKRHRLRVLRSGLHGREET